MINIKNLDPNKTNVYENPHKNILIYYIGYVTVKNLYYQKKILSIKKRYFKESNGKNYLTLVPTDERIDASKDTLKRFEELCNKVKDIIRLIININNIN